MNGAMMSRASRSSFGVHQNALMDTGSSNASRMSFQMVANVMQTIGGTRVRHGKCDLAGIAEYQTNSYQGENEEREFLGLKGSVLQSNDKHRFNRK